MKSDSSSNLLQLRLPASLMARLSIRAASERVSVERLVELAAASYFNWGPPIEKKGELPAVSLLSEANAYLKALESEIHGLPNPHPSERVQNLQNLIKRIDLVVG